MESIRERIAARARLAGLQLSTGVLDGLVTYFEILRRWNARMNLTSFEIGHPTNLALDRLIIEPVLASRYVPPETRLSVDVGSGGGSPALPMRLAAPYGQWVLVESKQRKGAFLRQAVQSLELSGVGVFTGLFATFADRRSPGSVDLVTMRAVRADADLWSSILRVLAPSGRLVWFTSEHQMPDGFTVIDSHQPLFVILRPRG